MRRSAFTLIELLVTISIIAVLVSLSLVAFNSSRAIARDGKRKADLEAIRSALEIYRSDTGEYPLQLTTLQQDYIAIVPADPNAPARMYNYVPSCAPTCTGYVLCAAVELGGSTVSGCGSCVEPCNYITTNP